MISSQGLSHCLDLQKASVWTYNTSGLVKMSLLLEKQKIEIKSKSLCMNPDLNICFLGYCFSQRLTSMHHILYSFFCWHYLIFWGEHLSAKITWLLSYPSPIPEASVSYICPMSQ